MIIDQLFQTNPWSTHLPNDGSNIGGTMPENTALIPRPASAPDGILLYIKGGPYASFEAYQMRPVLPHNGGLQLLFSLQPDLNAATSAQAIEVDTILTVGGWTYNLSMQINYEEEGMIQVADATGKWVDTGVKIGLLDPATVTRFSVLYEFDEAKHTSAVRHVMVGPTVHDIPEALQNIPAVQKGWTDGAIMQVQLDTNARGGEFSVSVDGCSYVWS